MTLSMCLLDVLCSSVDHFEQNNNTSLTAGLLPNGSQSLGLIHVSSVFGSQLSLDDLERTLSIWIVSFLARSNGGRSGGAFDVAPGMNEDEEPAEVAGVKVTLGRLREWLLLLLGSLLHLGILPCPQTTSHLPDPMRPVKLDDVDWRLGRHMLLV